MWFLIQVDDENILHNVIFENSDSKSGILSQSRQGNPVGIRCAPYSKLAGATAAIDSKNIILVCYQNIEQHGPVYTISLIPRNS